jgi:hypothetical protein
MTTLNEARGIINTAYITGSGLDDAHLDLDNEKFDPPTGDAWARLVVRHAARGQESLGGVGLRKFESVGTAIIQCFAPLESGAAEADTLAQVAMGIFEGKTLSGVRFTAAAPIEIGPGKDWYQINVEAFFTYTETK